MARYFSQLTLCTTPFFSKAIRLYEKFGFVFTAERGDLFGIELLHMEKKFVRQA
jgi:ribosomal protein S18 acetylase RimI-like enzyme